MNDLAFVLAGFVVGGIVGLTGVGGGSLMTPILIFGFGIKPYLAIGTDLLFAAFTKMGGTVSMARQRLVPWRVVGLLCAGSIPAALAALWLLHRMGPATAQAQHLMTSTLGFALLLTAAATAYKVLAFSPQRQAAEVAARRANAANAAEPRHWSLPVLLGAVIGMLVTFTSVGAGAIGVTVLLLVFVGGCCTAMLTPAWNSSVIDPVPRDEWPQAITAVSIAYNAARAVGPTLAGLVFAHWGAGWVFAISVLSTLVMWESIRRWPPKAHPPSRLPAERLWGGMLSALRFAWHSDLILAQLVRVMAFGAAGSALWALLPVIAQRQLGTGAQGFGLLMGCLGTGAVVAGLLIGRLRVRFGLERLVAGGCVVFATAMGIAALSTSGPLVYAALVAGGGAWMSVMSTYNTATQTSVPPWVRARATAMHTLFALGSFAIGSAFWGAVSDLLGLTPALLLAAAAMAAGLLLARPFPLRMGGLPEVTQATLSEDLFVAHEPDPEAGPVAVEIGYRIRPEDTTAFLDTLSQMRGPRRRD